MESKFATLQLLPEAFRPQSALLPAGISDEDIQKRIEEAGLTFPMILKPDLGFRGLLVKKVNSMTALTEGLKVHDINFIAQEYIDWPEEAGALYHRLPGEPTGQITSITT